MTCGLSWESLDANGWEELSRLDRSPGRRIEKELTARRACWSCVRWKEDKDKDCSAVVYCWTGGDRELRRKVSDVYGRSIQLLVKSLLDGHDGGRKQGVYPDIMGSTEIEAGRGHDASRSIISLCL